MVFENNYFNSDEVWDVNRVLGNAQELSRFTMTKSLIPDAVINLLDIGCGNGAFMYFLEQEGLDIKMTGLEYSRVAIENRVSKSLILESSITGMPFGDSEFEIVSALEVIEHLPYNEFSFACSEIQRVASKYILISVPYKEKRVFATCPACLCKFSPIYHLRSFNDDSLLNLFPKFKMIGKKFVNIESYYFAEELRKINYEYRIKWENELVCPQCGYYLENSKTTKKSHIDRVNPFYIDIIKKIIPKKTRPHWVICLYERQ